MGKRGPAKTPTAKLKARGSWRAKARAVEPKPEPGLPDCPAELDGVAKAVWFELVPQLQAMGVLTRIDGNALMRYCRTWARWRACDDFVKEHGEAYPIKDKDGAVKCLMHFPQASQADKLAQQLLRLEQQFGMTPAARAGLSVGQSGEKAAQGKSRFFAAG